MSAQLRIASGTRATAQIFAAAFLLYGALALAITFPLILHLTSRLPHDLGDPLIASSVLWWDAHVRPLSTAWWDGFGFFPARGSTAFSADELGASLIATPLQWLGAGPITAYNLVFLLSWPLSAVAAHACAYSLTRRHDAGFVCGLAFGFNPQRVAHIEHLELLMTFGMAAALAALHRYADTRRRRWAALFAAALVIQALCASYYALFFTVFFGLWLIWFVRPSAWRQAATLVLAGAGAVLVMAPVFMGYRRVHGLYGMERAFQEVVAYSADVSSVVTASSLSALWSWTATLNGREGQLFPGLTIGLLAIAGVLLLYRGRVPTADRVSTIARASAVAAGIAGVVALVVFITGPVRLDWGWLRFSASLPYKPLSIAVALAAIAAALSGTARTAFRQRSPLAFYLVAAVVLFTCSFGPEPTLLGTRVLYQPPYAWLMQLPFFEDTVRVPARFGMLGALALSLAASLAFARLIPQSRKTWMLAIVSIAIVAEGWVRGLALLPPPPRLALPPEAEAVAAVLELPLGQLLPDTAAMYRATRHGKRTINGYNGYEPRYYQVLRLALANHDDTVLDALASFGSLLITVDRDHPADVSWASFVAAHPDVTALEGDRHWAMFVLPAQAAPAQPACAGAGLPIVAATANDGAIDPKSLTDSDPATRWLSPRPQRAGTTLVLDLGQPRALCDLIISMGHEAELYPRTLEVATSLDGNRWTTALTQQMGGATLRATLANPLDAQTDLPLPGDSARFVRLRLLQADAVYHWALAEVRVRATTPR